MARLEKLAQAHRVLHALQDARRVLNKLSKHALTLDNEFMMRRGAARLDKAAQGARRVARFQDARHAGHV